MYEGARVHVMTRADDAKALALELGVTSVQGSDDPPPEPLDAALLFAPVGSLVPTALRALDAGGTLVIAGIYLTDIPSLSYERELFRERTVTSVTANTRKDGEEWLAIAAKAHVRVVTAAYSLADAERALVDLEHDRVNGAAVLCVS
jgi:propanol-preferring alcohol dehydrogenase